MIVTEIFGKGKGNLKKNPRPGRDAGGGSEQVQGVVQIQGLPDVDMVLRAGQIVQQELQQQGGAQAAALDLELGKAHGEINVPDIVHADEAGVLHGLGEAVAPGGVGGGAAVLRAGLP